MMAAMNSSHTWWTPQIRSCLICLALLLPGSFFVLPLVWLWRRAASAWASRDVPGSPRSHP